MAFLYVIAARDHAEGMLGLVQAAHRDPLLYVIAPFFLGLFARFAGIREYAEQFGLSGSIDAMVLRKASRRLAELGETDVWISVNLARTTLGDGRFLRSLEEAIELAQRLKARGCRVILDEVGLNLTLARQLRKLSVDVIKLDGDLVCRLNEPGEQRIASTLAAIAQDMGIETVAIAKFVENPGSSPRTRARHTVCARLRPRSAD